MTATPSIDFDEAWRAHKMNCAATAEVAEQADSEMRKLLNTLRAYRLHKKRCVTETEVDYGILAELIVQLELTVGLP